MVDNFLSTVKWLHVELSSRCNAWCPSCPRNIDGYKLIDGLIEEDLPLEKLANIISTLPMLKTIQLCGNYGDPISAKNISEVIDFLIKKKFDIQIHTNGSLKTKNWWSEFGNKLKDMNHKIYFAIDGLEDTHKIYRQGTDYKKIIENATAFISSGGNAIWQFIPFAHNEHQLKECLILSKKLGFKNFDIVKRPRVNSNATHYKTGKKINLEPWTYQDKFFNTITSHNEKNSSCMHLEYSSLYVSANGKISPCCYLPKIEYNEELEIKKELTYNPRKECVEYCNFKGVE